MVSEDEFTKHTSTDKHTRKQAATKSPQGFYCKPCNVGMVSNKDFSRHLLTNKHIRKQMETDSSQNLHKAQPQHTCEICNKVYNSRAGLWKHKKTCNAKQPELKNELRPFDDDDSERPAIENSNVPIQNIPITNIITVELVIDLIKQNKELQELLVNELKQAKAQQITTNIQNHSSGEPRFPRAPSFRSDTSGNLNSLPILVR